MKGETIEIDREFKEELRREKLSPGEEIFETGRYAIITYLEKHGMPVFDARCAVGYLKKRYEINDTQCEQPFVVVCENGCVAISCAPFESWYVTFEPVLWWMILDLIECNGEVLHADHL